MTFLNISGNMFETLPSAISDAVKLKKLIAYNNVLTSIADVDFSKMADLTEINFMKNYIAEIKGGTFAKNSHLLSVDLHDNQLKLLSAEAAADVAKSLRPPVVDNEESLSYYNTILARTVEYGDLLQQIQSGQEALTALEENQDAVRAQIHNFDEAVHAALAALQEIRKEVSETADSICLENALVLTAYPNDPETIDPVIAHGHAGVSSAENFQIIVIFSGLVGLALGMFLAVCRGAKKAELPPDSPSKESANPN